MPRDKKELVNVSGHANQQRTISTQSHGRSLEQELSIGTNFKPMSARFPSIRLEPFGYAFKWADTEHPKDSIDKAEAAVSEVKKEHGLKYVLYTIVNNDTKMEFKRRFDEFETLYNILTEVYPCICIPKLPPKRLKKADERVVKDRRYALPFWLNYITSHPVLAYDDCVIKFCSNSDVSEWNNSNNWHKWYKKKHFCRRIIPTFCATTSTFSSKNAILLHKTSCEACKIIEEFGSPPKFNNDNDILKWIANQLQLLANFLSEGLIPAQYTNLKKLRDVAKKIRDNHPNQIRNEEIRLTVTGLSRGVFRKLKGVTYLAAKAFKETNDLANRKAEYALNECIVVNACVTAEFNFVINKQLDEYIIPMAELILRKIGQAEQKFIYNDKAATNFHCLAKSCGDLLDVPRNGTVEFASAVSLDSYNPRRILNRCLNQPNGYSDIPTTNFYCLAESCGDLLDVPLNGSVEFDSAVSLDSCNPRRILNRFLSQPNGYSEIPKVNLSMAYFADLNDGRRRMDPESR